MKCKLLALGILILSGCSDVKYENSINFLVIFPENDEKCYVLIS